MSPQDILQCKCSIGDTKPVWKSAPIKESQSFIVRTPRWLSRFIWVLIGLLVVVTFLSSCADVALASDVQYLTASYYSTESLIKEGTYAYSHGQMANGQYFRDSAATSACNSYALGSRLLVTNLRNGKSVVVVNTDRTAKRFKGKRIDLSKKSFATLVGGEQNLKIGLIKVSVILLDKERSI